MGSPFNEIKENVLDDLSDVSFVLIKVSTSLRACGRESIAAVLYDLSVNVDDIIDELEEK